MQYDLAITAMNASIQELQARREAIIKQNDRIDLIERSTRFAGIGILAFDAMLFLTGHWVWLGVMLLGGNLPVIGAVSAIEEKLLKGKVRRNASQYDIEIATKGNVVAELQKQKQQFVDMLKYRSQAGTAERHSSMGLNDCYAMLECQPNASDAEIRTAFRKISHEYHPDLLESLELGPHLLRDAEEKFKKLNEAKETIMKSREKR